MVNSGNYGIFFQFHLPCEPMVGEEFKFYFLFFYSCKMWFSKNTWLNFSFSLLEFQVHLFPQKYRRILCYWSLDLKLSTLLPIDAAYNSFFILIFLCSFLFSAGLLYEVNKISTTTLSKNESKTKRHWVVSDVLLPLNGIWFWIPAWKVTN